MEGVGWPLFSRRLWLVAPDEEGVVFASTGGTFPFRLGGETFLGPLAVGFRIFFGDADDGVIHFVLDGAIGAGGMTPV